MLAGIAVRPDIAFDLVSERIHPIRVHAGAHMWDSKQLKMREKKYGDSQVSKPKKGKMGCQLLRCTEW